MHSVRWKTKCIAAAIELEKRAGREYRASVHALHPMMLNSFGE